MAQETYLRAWIAEPRETIEQPKAFLFHVAKNLALTRLTQKSRQITDYIEEAGATEVIETAAGTDQDLEAQQCLDLYCAAVATLPEKCRQVFLYRKVHGLSHKDIGERMRRERPIAQLMINALALSRRTGLRLYDFTCAWFDEHDYFEFYPLQVVHKRKQRLNGAKH